MPNLLQRLFTRRRNPQRATPRFDPLLAQDPGYDEVFAGPDQVRPQYAAVLPRIESKTVAEMADFKKLSQRKLREKYGLSPIPRMITADDNRILRDGTAQRARALRAFLKDHHTGEKSYIKKGIVPAVVAEQIARRHHEHGIEGLIPADGMGYIYGPDIIRAPDGAFHVIEDNLGCVGGIGQLEFNRDFVFKQFPDVAETIDSPDPSGFWRSFTDGLKAASVDGGKVVNVNYSDQRWAHKAWARTQPILKRYGIPTVILDAPKYGTNSLEVKPDGVYFRDARGRREKVGMVMSSAWAYSLDPMDPASFDRSLVQELRRTLYARRGTRKRFEAKGDKAAVGLLDDQIAEMEALLEPNDRGELDYGAMTRWARRIDKTYDPKRPVPERGRNVLGAMRTAGFPGLLEAFRKGQIGMHNSPGASLATDKQTYMYVEDFVRHYLGEEPILKNLPTASFQTWDRQGRPKLHKALFDEVFDDKRRSRDAYVIKKVDGSGGAEVWVGPKLPSWDAFAELAEPIRKNPGAYIVQQYMPLSRVDGEIVDYRMHTVLRPDRIDVSPVPWARTNDPVKGAGKVNLCGNGSEQAVFVEDTKGKKSVRRTPQPSVRSRDPGEQLYRLRSIYDRDDA